MSDRDLRVCVLAPIGRDARLSCEMLQAEGIAASVCDSIEQICASIDDTTGALLIAEEALQPAALQTLVTSLDQQPPWSDIAVIVLAGGQFTASSERPLTVLGPLRNVTILERPVRRLILARTVAIALRGRRRQLELRAYIEERAELLRREQAANQMKDEFLMTVSHELRTPLTAIYGWARMLVTGQIREDQKRRAIETIERNAQAQTQLVNDLLDVSRAMSGKVRLDVQPVDLSHVVLAAIDSMQPAADAKGIRLQASLDPTAGPVSADRDRMLQVVWNLLSNAIKFTPRDGHVNVVLASRADQVELVVSDTGSGIAPDFLPHVFERFRQADAGTTRQYGGLGLGLAIVRHLVELHGGSVTVDSDGPGRGTTFRVAIPLTVPQRSVVEEKVPGALQAGQAAGARSVRRLDDLRVLVVDDEPQARELFSAIVEHAGAEVRLAGSPRDAMAILRSWHPDVLLSDIEMPHEDGYVLMEQVTATDAGQRPIAIAITAHSRPEDRLRALEVGFSWHLPKPIEPAELVAVIASLTGRLHRT
ncbi:MAG: multi-sensor hybrid histidine kinase [Acidobacteria bacterium]|nr:multi-sensor hybrid histidine kinase [Acidobacteriota bacterium]